MPLDITWSSSPDIQTICSNAASNGRLAATLRWIAFGGQLQDRCTTPVRSFVINITPAEDEFD
jgi:hypothetical protein